MLLRITLAEMVDDWNALTGVWSMKGERNGLSYVE